MTELTREAVAEALARQLVPDHFNDAYRAESERAGYPVPDPVNQFCMTSFVANDDHRSLRILTFGEVADVLLASGVVGSRTSGPVTPAGDAVQPPTSPVGEARVDGLGRLLDDVQRLLGDAGWAITMGQSPESELTDVARIVRVIQRRLARGRILETLEREDEL